MIALCTAQGAFLYNCSEREADARINNINHSPDHKYAIHVKGGLDFDDNGKRRLNDGMVGWLFMQPGLIRMFEKLGVAACYIDDGQCYRKVTDFEVLANAYEKVFSERNSKKDQ